MPENLGYMVWGKRLHIEYSWSLEAASVIVQRIPETEVKHLATGVWDPSNASKYINMQIWYFTMTAFHSV